MPPVTRFAVFLGSFWHVPRLLWLYTVFIDDEVIHARPLDWSVSSPESTNQTIYSWTPMPNLWPKKPLQNLLSAESKRARVPNPIMYSFTEAPLRVCWPAAPPFALEPLKFLPQGPAAQFRSREEDHWYLFHSYWTFTPASPSKPPGLQVTPPTHLKFSVRWVRWGWEVLGIARRLQAVGMTASFCFI